MSFAPLQPESFTHASAKRVSVTPARRAVLPPREWPTTATRVASICGSVSSQSSTRLAPQAQALSAPQLCGVRAPALHQARNTPVVMQPTLSSRATSPFQNVTAA